MSKPPPPQSNLIQPLSEDQAARLRPRPHGQCKILPDFGQPSEVATWRDELRGSAEVSLLIVSTLAILRELLFPRQGKRLPGCRHVHEHFAVFGRFGPETLLVMLAGHRSKVWVRHLRRKGCNVILVWQHNDLRAHVKSSYSLLSRTTWVWSLKGTPSSPRHGSSTFRPAIPRADVTIPITLSVPPMATTPRRATKLSTARQANGSTSRATGVGS